MASTAAKRTTEGIHGTIVAAHTPSGLPQGANPHDVSQSVIQIRNMVTGAVTEMAIGAITPDMVREAGRDVGPIPVAAVEEEQDAWTDALLGRIKEATQATRGVMSESYDMSAVAASAEQPRSQPVRPVQPRPFQPRPAGAGRPVTSLQAVSAPPAAVKPEPPAKEVAVTFEIIDTASIPAAYADVLVLPDQYIVVLVLDPARHGRQFVPQLPTDGQEPPRTAMQIDGSNDIYEIRPTGIQFSHQGTEFVVLYIVAAGTGE